MNATPWNTPEAKEKQRQRRALPSIDPLAERARLVTYWKHMAQTFPAFGPVWCWAFYYGTFRRHLMPRLRDFLTSRTIAAEAAWRDELHQSCERYRIKKALAKAGPMPLFEQPTLPTA